MKLITRKSALIGSFMVLFSMTGHAASSKTDIVEKCRVAAESIVRKTIENMGLAKDEYGFALDESKKIGKSYDDSAVMEYSTNMIITPDGFFPGANAHVVLVIREKECDISDVTVNLNRTLMQ